MTTVAEIQIENSKQLWTRSSETCAAQTKNRKGGDKRPTILKVLSHEIMIVKTVGPGAAKQAWGVGSGARNFGFCLKGCVWHNHVPHK